MKETTWIIDSQTGELTVEVEFLLPREQAEKLLDIVRGERVRVVYAMNEAEIGETNGDA